MKTIYKPSLVEILPESLLQDPKIRAAAQAIDFELEKLSADVRQVLHIPRLDELTGNVIDYIAEALHIDFWEPLYLTEPEKKNLIRESIAWHRIKGTVAAVKEIAKWAWRDAEIIEPRDDPDLLPYRFRIITKGFKQTPDGVETFRRMIDCAKNVRSWLDKIIIDYSHLMPPINLYAGFGHGKIGLEVIGLARPADGRIDLSAGVGNGKFGTVTFGLTPPDILDNENRLNAGHVLIKSGVLTIGADMDDLYKLPEIRECAIADLLIADVGIARPSGVPIDRQDYSGFVGHVFIKQGTIKIGADLDDLGNKPWLINEHYSGFIGHAFIKQGTITIQADLSDLEGERWIRENGIADLLIADVGIARPMDVSGQPDEPEDEEAVPDGLWLRNYFDYPTGRDHPVLLANPRDDLTVADVRAVGKYAADNRVFINSKAESTLGIRKASLIHGYELMTADDNLKLPATGKIRLFFDFATGNHRKILLQERRDDLTVGDLKTFGAYTTSNRILMNARGEPSTGLTHAAVIRDFAINSLPDDTPIKF